LEEGDEGHLIKDMKLVEEYAKFFDWLYEKGESYGVG
jgi:hypothetical protein